MTNLTIMLIGFSIFSCLILLSAYLWFLKDMRKTLWSKVSCSALLLSLTALQLLHFQYFQSATELLTTKVYGLLLAFVPICFYFFSRSILTQQTISSSRSDLKFKDLVHLVPIVIATMTPLEYVPVIAFGFGSMYTLWFTHVVIQARGQTKRFKFELFFFAMFALMAVVALVLGLLLPAIEPRLFFLVYANTISIALLCINAALLFFPALLTDILIVGELAYSKSKLDGVDVESKVEELATLMQVEKPYQNETLTLATLAELLSLSVHQTSELINTQFGMGFPKYIRIQRVNAAKRLLKNDVKASILSIGLEVGFKSQSNFYTAFKEIAEVSPGEYRKRYSQ